MAALLYNFFRSTFAHFILEIVFSNCYPGTLLKDTLPVHEDMSFYYLFLLFQEIIRRMKYFPMILFQRLKIEKGSKVPRQGSYGTSNCILYLLLRKIMSIYSLYCKHKSVVICTSYKNLIAFIQNGFSYAS